MTALQLEPSAHAPWTRTTEVWDSFDSILVFLSSQIGRYAFSHSIANVQTPRQILRVGLTPHIA